MKLIIQIVLPSLYIDKRSSARTNWIQLKIKPIKSNKQNSKQFIKKWILILLKSFISILFTWYCSKVSFYVLIYWSSPKKGYCQKQLLFNHINADKLDLDKEYFVLMSEQTQQFPCKINVWQYIPGYITTNT